MIKISIIVPVYNVELYLKDCLDSILSQNFSDMEIICVEDKSTDNSLNILKDYEKKYENIKVYEHDVNRGLSAARNTGIRHATGKYVWFVDSDDMIKPNSCDLLYNCAEKEDVDIVYFNMEILNEDIENINKKTGEYIDIEGVYLGRELFCKYIKLGIFKVEAWRQFFRRQFIIDNNLFFYEGIYMRTYCFLLYLP